MNKLFSLQSSLTCNSLERKDNRFKECRSFNSSIQRSLERDRKKIHSQESNLLQKIKKHIDKGDRTSAELLAKQLLTYRRLNHRNLSTAIELETKIKSSELQNKISKSSIETLKGLRYANEYESYERVGIRVQKYDSKSFELEQIEELMEENFGELFGVANEFNCFDVDCVLHESGNGKRIYFGSQGDKLAIQVRNCQSEQDFCVYVDTLDISVDMFKRLISHQLNVNANEFKIGAWDAEKKKIVSFDICKSLKELGIKNKSVVFIE